MPILRFERRPRTSSPKQRARLAFSLTICLGCSGARLDPNTKAITFETAALEGGSEPKTPGTTPNTPPVSSTSAPRGPANVAPANNSPDGRKIVRAEPTSNPVVAQNQVCSRLPDPQALVTDQWLRVTLRYNHGDLSIVTATEERARRKSPTPRRMGRFAAELWIGCELIDRVRFDFPLLAGEDASAGKPHQPNFAAGGQFETEILVPHSARATRLEVRDRARETDPHLVLVKSWPLKLPQGESTGAESAPSTPQAGAQ